MPIAPSASPSFGSRLRSWRRRRGFTQLALALAAGTTPRHVSFLETGRSRPGRDLVLRLTDALSVPLRERNRLLEAAGLPAVYAEEDLASADLAPFRAVVERMLAQHDPFPGFLFDRRWNILRANTAGERLLAGTAERNGVRLLYALDGAWRQILDNWATVALHGLRQLADDVERYAGDEELQELFAFALTAVEEGPAAPEPAGHAVAAHLRLGGQLVRTVTVIARFGSPRDALLEEVRLELVAPADADAEALLRAAAGRA